jgi:hypothetical protein
MRGGRSWGLPFKQTLHLSAFSSEIVYKDIAARGARTYECWADVGRASKGFL